MPEPSDYIAFLRGLRAVRRFRPEPIPDGVVADLLEVARWTGSSMNRQPWELIVVRDRETLRTLATLSPYTGHVAEAALGIVLVMAGEDPVDETYDEGRLSERIMLAARAHGVGSCIGWFDEDAGEPAAKALLGVPAGRTVRTVISLGYPAEDAARGRRRREQARKPLAEILHAERYGRRPA